MVSPLYHSLFGINSRYAVDLCTGYKNIQTRLDDKFPKAPSNKKPKEQMGPVEKCSTVFGDGIGPSG